MTTDIKTENTEDVSKNNIVVKISKDKLPANIKLAGASWLVSFQPRNESLLTTLRFIFRRAVGILPRFKFWILIGHSAWQPDTRIVRYRKLWDSLRIRGVEISHGGESYENVIETQSKVKFFGAKQFSELSIASVVKAIMEENCACILVLPENIQIKHVLDKGWSADDEYDANLLKYIGETDGILIKAVGKFDDMEKGFVVVGKPELIQQLIEPVR